jgi:hypothetical protein
MQSKSTTRFWFIVSILILVSLACNAITQPFTTAQPTSTPPAESLAAPTEVPPNTPQTPAQPTESETASTPAVQISPTPPPGAYAPAFAEYRQISVNLPASSPAGYTLPVDLSSVQGTDLLTLSPQQQALLSQNGFTVAAPIPGKYREFYQLYESQRYNEVPIFITTDAVFHVYHLIFDKMLRDLERDSFIPTLEGLTHAMLQTSMDQYQAAMGTALEEPARRNAAFFAVAAQLLELSDPVPAQLKDLVDAEVALINAHSGPQISPIWDRPDLPPDKKLIEDYSQYIPRGHYTRSEALKRYFKAMMWYGRLTFRLRDAFETRRALLLVQALRTTTTDQGSPATQLWQNIYEPTVFIVGKADDLSYFEYAAISDAIFGNNPELQDFADDTKLDQFIQAARQLPPPQVNSMWVWIWEDKTEATQGFRFMGQRFTLDAYVFGQVIWRNVGTDIKPRGLPKALDFFAAMGSEEALNILDAMGETQYENYSTQMDKVRNEIASLQIDSWTQNIYWSWLYAFQPVIQPKDDRFPVFMQTQAWTRKDLNTALGSWTELKHDTILYAKQVMAEMGGGVPEQPPHGYVEPNPEVYARLQALAQMTYDGLNSRGLLSEITKGNLENLLNTLSFLKDTSEKELAGQVLADEDYWRIQYFGGELESFTLAASDCDQADLAACRDLQDQKAALIADVATGLDPQGNLAALEEAIGGPTEIYVVLPDQPWRVAVGGVFTYYEFPVPPENRMTDEQWQAKVEDGSNPPSPDWTSLFMAP